MLQLLLTGLAGVALGIVIMRMMQKPAAQEIGEERLLPIEAQQTESEGEGQAELSAQNKSFSIRSLTSTQMAFGGAGAMALLAVGVLALRPSDAATDTVSAPTAVNPAGSEKSTALDDVDTMIKRLAERLKKDTSDGEGFRMLGWSYVNTGHPAEAVEAYAQSAKLLPDRADVQAGYGEAMVALAKDVVTPEAKARFDTALKLDPKEPRARFFASLYKSQHGEERQALDEWIALSNAENSDLPWQTDIRKRIDQLAKKLGVDVTGRMKASAPPSTASATPSAPFELKKAPGGGPDAATMAAASALPAAQQQGMIDGMVSGLAAKLAANPDNVDGWIKLIRSRVVLKDAARAKDDLAMARKEFKDSPDKLGAINATAKELGL
jgi:cytochrome c-type biogenesis protein CcmH